MNNDNSSKEFQDEINKNLSRLKFTISDILTGPEYSNRLSSLTFAISLQQKKLNNDIYALSQLNKEVYELNALFTIVNLFLGNFESNISAIKATNPNSMSDTTLDAYSYVLNKFKAGNSTNNLEAFLRAKDDK